MSVSKNESQDAPNEAKRGSGKKTKERFSHRWWSCKSFWLWNTMNTKSSDLFKGYQINSRNWNVTKATKIHRNHLQKKYRPVCTVFPAHLLSAPTGTVHWVKHSDPVQPGSHSHCSVWKHTPLTNNHGTDRITENRTAKLLERSSNLLSCLWVESVVHDLLWQMSNLFFKTFKSKLF